MKIKSLNHLGDCVGKQMALLRLCGATETKQMEKNIYIYAYTV